MVGLGHVEAVVTEMPRPWGVVPAPQGAPHDAVRGRRDQGGCRGREAWAECDLRIQGADNDVRHREGKRDGDQEEGAQRTWQGLGEACGSLGGGGLVKGLELIGA